MFKVSDSTPAREAAARAYLRGTVRLDIALRMVRGDGQVFAWTRAQNDVRLPAMTWGAITIPETLYYSGRGNFPKSITQSRDLAQVDSWSFEAFVNPNDPKSGYVKSTEVARGAFHDARHSLILFARDTFGPGDTRRFAWLRQRGFVGDKTLDKGKVTWRMNGLARALQAEVLEVTSAFSQKKWGDPELAGFNLNGNTADGFPARVNATITSLGIPRRQCTVAALVGFPSDRFTDGSVMWTSGGNAGLEQSILHFDADTGTLLFDENTPLPIQAGDGLRVQIKAPQSIEEWKLIVGDPRGFPAQPELPTRNQGGIGR